MMTMKLYMKSFESVMLVCECATEMTLHIDNFKEITDDYAVLSDDTQIVCKKCGKAHTEPLIMKCTPITSKRKSVRCPACRSDKFERITVSDKATALLIWDVPKVQNYRCRNCRREWI